MPPGTFDETLKIAIDQMIEGIQIISSDWRYLYLNQAAALHGRRPREELIGRTMMECYPGIDQTPVFKEFEQVKVTARPRRIENEFEFPHLGRCWFELWIEPYQEGLLIRSVDITERKRLEEQLRHAQKMEAVGRLAGGIAHDYNNKLAIMLVYGELLQERLEDPLSVAQVKKILEAVRQSSTLTKQLLAFSRKQVLDCRAINLNSVLSGLEAGLSKMLGEDIQVVFKLSSEVQNVLADPNQIEQVVLNLCINARDAMSGGGVLTIESTNAELDEQYCKSHSEVAPGRYVMIAVSDTGTGMTPEVRSRIFEPFFTTKGPEKGTGLGLASVHGIIKQLKGHIWVYSEPGRGTVFKIYLPAIDQMPEEAVQAARASASHRGHEAILLVEDDSDLREAFQTSLESAGYRVFAAGNPEGAEEIFRANGSIQLLMTDLILPGANGHQLAEKLLASKPELKVIYVSGYTENTIVHQGILDSDAVLLQKPVSLSRLLETVRMVMTGMIRKGVF